MPRELNIHDPACPAPEDGLWGKVALPALLVLTASMLLAIGGTTLAVSRAALREESAAAARVFDLHPYMMPLGALAALVLLGASVRVGVASARAKAWPQAAAMAMAGGAVALAAYPLAWGAWAGMEPWEWPVAVKIPGRVCLTGHGQAALTGLALAAGLWIARAWWTRARRVAALGGARAETCMTACLRRISGREILAGLPGACLSAVAGCLAVCLPLSLPSLLNMTGSAGDFLAALLLLTCCVAVLALLVCVVLQLVWLTWVSAIRASGTDGKTSALAGGLSAAMLFFLVRWGLWLAFSSEMGRLGLDLLFDAVLLVGAMFYGLGVSRNLLALSADAAPRDAGQFIRLCILAGALLPVLPVIRLLKGRVVLSRRLILTGCLVMAVLAVALAMPFFQKLDDHFTRINTTLAVLIVVLAILLGLALVPPHPRAWGKKLVALSAVAVPCLVVVATSAFAMANSRAEMNLYSPIGKATAQLLDPLMPAPAQSQAATSTELQTASRPQREPVMDAIKGSRPLVVLLLWDACRPDHMNLFGYQRKTAPLLSTTPNLDRHKDEFLRFTTCFSHGTGTTCSMRQMLTSRYSSRWMLRTKGVDPFWLNDLAANG
ncbi:MAG: sulfatase-like hydrolase/transferase, partial [Planctomycetota bacterium]|nr:sulfatase-like hydrolase/transferase [Planctomycetota bacterium]